MRLASFVLLIVISLTIPKTWNAIKGPGTQNFSKKLISNSQDPLSREGATILAQPFYYWGKGSQFYVYLSNDHRYVLKIPRASKVRESLIDRMIGRTVRKANLLTSMQIAQKHLAMQTALIVVHTEKLNDPIPSVLLYDHLHRGRRVDLNSVPFALQKYEHLLSSALTEAVDHNESKKILIAFLDLILLENKKGWMSTDSAFWLNFGYENGNALRLDVGSYVPLNYRFSWRRVTKPLFHWLRENDPSLVKWLEAEIELRECL